MEMRRQRLQLGFADRVVLVSGSRCFTLVQLASASAVSSARHALRLPAGSAQPLSASNCCA